MNIRELRDQLGKRIDAAHFRNENTIITKNSSEPRAVLMSYETYLAMRAAMQDLKELRKAVRDASPSPRR